jgi:folate-dependent phosphoribosylglycinamide formyltransferase PurN
LIKTVLLAPVGNSLYARLIANALSREEDIEISAVVVRSIWNPRRLRNELKRDGGRLMRKIYQKLVVGDKRFSENKGNNLAALAHQQQLKFKNLSDLTKKLGIPYHVVADHNHLKCLEILQEHQPDVIIFTGGGLLRPPLLAIPRLGVLNCHTGILPQYRGMDVVEWTAVEEKVGQIGFGATLHFLDSGVDTGPILLKKMVTLSSDATFENIRAELETLMVELMICAVQGLRDGSVSPIPQVQSEGRQYFVMHPRIKIAAQTRLERQRSEV